MCNITGFHVLDEIYRILRHKLMAWPAHYFKVLLYQRVTS